MISPSLPADVKLRAVTRFFDRGRNKGWLGKSNAVIAAHVSGLAGLQTSHETVRRARAKLVHGEKIADVKERRDARGRNQTIGARGKKRRARPPSDQAGELSVVRDAAGALVPPELEDTFRSLKDQMNMIETSLKAAEQCVTSPLVWNKWAGWDTVRDKIRAAVDEVQRQRNLSEPHQVHRECSGVGCEHCRGTGYLPRAAVR